MSPSDMQDVIRRAFGADHIFPDKGDVVLSYTATSPSGAEKYFMARLSATDPVRENIRAIEDARHMAKDWTDGVLPGGLEDGLGG